MKMSSITSFIRVILLASTLNIFFNAERLTLYKTLFRDDFNTSNLDRQQWEPWECETTFEETKNMSRRFISSLQILSENTFVKDDKLKLLAQRVIGRDEQAGFVSGGVTSSIKQNNPYGLLEWNIEWLARIPKAEGIWTGLWLESDVCNADNPCGLFLGKYATIQLDIKPYGGSIAVLWRNLSESFTITETNQTFEYSTDLSLDFHLYKLVWLRTKLAVHVDGCEVTAITLHKSLNFLSVKASMSLLVGPQAHTGTHFPAVLLIDYVVIRQSMGQPWSDASLRSTTSITTISPAVPTAVPTYPSLHTTIIPSYTITTFPTSSTSDTATAPADVVTSHAGIFTQSWNSSTRSNPKNGSPVFESSWLPMIISLAALLVGVSIIVPLVFICMKRQRKIRQKSLQPCPADLVYSAALLLSDCETPLNAHHGPAKTFKFASEDQQSSLSYSLEVPFNFLEKTSEKLGGGYFGSVWKGFLRKTDGSDGLVYTAVAIKTFLDQPNYQEELLRRLFMEEINIMIKVGRHLNIVNLLATVKAGNTLLMALEFCCNGSLLDYLRSHRNSFENNVNDNGFLISGNTTSLSGIGNDYLNFESISLLPRGNKTIQNAKDSADEVLINTQDLINMSYQIARGLEYLAARSIIHRDLAARNVLVCQNKVVKISDFGLARERILSDYILQNNEIALPIKWMAPESILKKNFSYKSDVWSFGILLWELFSLGETPFSAVDVSNDVIGFARSLSRGTRRMLRPNYAPVFMYNIMLHCWKSDKDSRPSASALRTELSTFLVTNSENYFVSLDKPHEAYNLAYFALKV